MGHDNRINSKRNCFEFLCFLITYKFLSLRIKNLRINKEFRYPNKDLNK